MGNTDVTECPLCGENTPMRFESSFIHDKLSYRLKCRTCGNYLVGIRTIKTSQLSNHEQKHLFSGIIRNNDDGKPLTIPDDVNQFLSEHKQGIPQGVLEIADHILRHIFSRTSFIGELVKIMIPHDYPIGYCQNQEEFDYILQYLQEAAYIKRGTDEVRLTVKGLQKVDELQKKRPKGDQCFVAMSFAKELECVYSDAIKRAIGDAGYDDYRVDKDEHNDKIDDKIISEIRRSSLMVADVTMHKQGVYFEAGFALGLGIPVIWTCHEDEIKDAHFDTRQYNHIVWKTTDDLYIRLLDRINALYPLKEQ